ncbi:hypothetical protein [Actinomadura sp. KC06]|nr:hypothetical protein [Actinomadura sp. KC06]
MDKEPLPPVPKDGAGPTETDEDDVLRGLYGEAENGIYRGEGAE